MTVKNASVKLDQSTLNVAANDTAKLTATVKPASSADSLTFKSSDESVATVSNDGTVTGIAVGNATITASIKCGTKTKTATATVTVAEAVPEVATLASVNQTAADTIRAIFTANATGLTKDDIKVVTNDNTDSVPVLSVVTAADGLSADITLGRSLADGKTYIVTYKDGEGKEFTAKIGAVTSVVITTSTAQQNVPTKIGIKLYDSENMDVTAAYNLDTTCHFGEIGGTFSTISIDKPSDASITMANIGDEATLKVIYNSGEQDAVDVESDVQTITCVKAEETKGTPVFTTKDVLNMNSGCAKFYRDLGDTKAVVQEDGSAEIYFYAYDANGDAISYDSYEVESADEDSVNASVASDHNSGKFAVIEVNGNRVCDILLNVTATKNGAESHYTIPVNVVKEAVPVRMVVSRDRASMSTSRDRDYYGTVTATFYDKDNNEVTNDVDVTFEVLGNSADGKRKLQLGSISDNARANKYTASPNVPGRKKGPENDFEVEAKTYTIKATGSYTKSDAVFTGTVTVKVEKLNDCSKEAYNNFTYQIVMDKVNVDAGNDEAVTARLQAMKNNKFVGYVRSSATATTDGAVTIGEDEDGDTERTFNGVNDKGESDKNEKVSVTVAARYGVRYYGKGGTLVKSDGQKYEDAAIAITTSGAITFDTLRTLNNSELTTEKTYIEDDTTTDSYSTYVVWNESENEGTVARKGTYTIEFRIYGEKGTLKDSNDKKYKEYTNNFKVENSIIAPTVNVLTRVSDSLELSAIKNGLKTNVDLNNNDGASISIIGWAASSDVVKDGTVNTGEGYEVGDPKDGKLTVKYVIVEENIGDNIWHFYIPINATFRNE